MLVIASMLVIVCITSGAEIILPKSSYVRSKKVHFDTDLNNLVVDRNTGSVYIGGRNRLYQLTPGLDIVASVQTGSQSDSNINKVLLVDYSLNHLITCGSIQGQCSTRNLQNISLPAQNIVSAMVSTSENASVVAFIAPGPDARWMVMNVGVTYDINSPYRNEIPAIATRSLKDDHIFQFEAPATKILFKLKSYIVKYVYGFSSWMFSYVMTIQLKQKSSQEYVTKLVRICQADTHYYSYTEIPISCIKNGTKYNLVQAAYLSKPTDGNDVLYAIFSQGLNGIPSNKSSLCTYTLESIENKFTENIQACFNGDGCTGLNFITPSKPCDKEYIEIPKYFCGSPRNSPFGGERAIVVESLATYEEQSTAIAVSQFNGVALVLIGTADGCIKKFTIQSGSTVNQTAKIKVFENSQIDAMQFDLQQSSMYVMSTHQVVKIDLYDNCTVFSSCDECVGAKNLYCGWCPHANSCTLKSNCLDEFSSSVSWKNYFWYQNGSLTQEMCAVPALTPNQTDFNFYPNIVAFDNKSLIRISTKNFINNFLPWYVNVKIAGLECAAYDIILHTVPLECTVKTSKIRHGKILIEQFRKAVISAEEFQFVDPKIVDFTPKYGPISGHTLITITGQYLNAGRKINAYIGDLPCYLSPNEKNQSVCKSSQAKDPQSLKLRMSFDNAVREYDQDFFRYGDDPTIISVATAKNSGKAPTCIPAGGLDIIVHGSNLKIVQKPMMYVYYQSVLTTHFRSDCIAQSDTVMTCVSPTINFVDINPDNPAEMEFGFIMDGVASVRDLSAKGFPKVQLFPNPTYESFPEMVKYIENQQLTIKGKNLNLACEMSDVRVYVGEYLCNITLLTRNLLACQPPQLQGNNEFFDVIVKVGHNLQFNVGSVSYDRPVNQFLNTIIIIVVTLSSIILICISVLSYRIFYDRRSMRELKAAGLQHFREGDMGSINPDIPFSEQADLLPYDSEYEFPKEQLTLGNELGSGAFGVVLKAIAKKILPNEDESTVAVKMVKRNYDNEVMRALVMELKIMIHLGHHDNVLNLLGAVTKNIDNRELMIIVEYCSFGNIKKYLETNRDHFIDQIDRDTDKIDSTIEAAQNHPNERTVNPTAGPSAYTKYDNVATARASATDTSDCERLIPRSSSVDSVDGSFSTTDLLKWSLQIVHGMQHLELRNIVHGDLAARNILLCDKKVVKICDFGLARSVYKSGIYWKKGQDPLPLKWMALESIMYQIFTTQSDVWSFGIVLWELFSLGFEPYPGTQLDENFINKLRKGHRNNKPYFTTQMIYELMLSCWRLYPESRPTFSDLEQEFTTILRDASSYSQSNSMYARE